MTFIWLVFFSTVQCCLIITVLSYTLLFYIAHLWFWCLGSEYGCCTHHTTQRQRGILAWRVMCAIEVLYIPRIGWRTAHLAHTSQKWNHINSISVNVTPLHLIGNQTLQISQCPEYHIEIWDLRSYPPLSINSQQCIRAMCTLLQYRNVR